jgi:tRNA A37 N6-isopentenylltransferase MiaA
MLTKKVICIAGTTGVGKSDLSISLAKALNGEIINADAMQVYRSLNIITNKIEDTEGVPHHILSTVDISKEYIVGQFVLDAERIIADIHARNKVFRSIAYVKIPIIVGGTHYWMHSLIWKNSIISDSIVEHSSDVAHESVPGIIADKIKSFLTDTRLGFSLNADEKRILSMQSHILLRKVDPDMADKWYIPTH